MRLRALYCILCVCVCVGGGGGGDIYLIMIYPHVSGLSHSHRNRIGSGAI